MATLQILSLLVIALAVLILYKNVVITLKKLPDEASMRKFALLMLLFVVLLFVGLILSGISMTH